MSKSIQDRLKRLEYLYRCLCSTPSGGTPGPQGPQGIQGIQGIQGVQGVQGPNGNDGTGVTILGSYLNYAQLILNHPTGNVGDSYITSDTGHLWVWSATSNTWVDVGNITGPQGIQGVQGIEGPQGVQGIQGIQGPPGTGGGGESCPDHFKLAAVSGNFKSESPNSPGINKMLSGTLELGWSHGKYNDSSQCDGFGNLTSIRFSQSYFGIPLPIDLNQGDTVRISGIAYLQTTGLITPVINPKFYVTVSHFNCSELDPKSATSLYTIIPVATYSITSNLKKVCFSESVVLSSVLAANETFFVVGLGIGNDDTLVSVDVRFSYSLDVTQVCIGTGENLFIRNCCDPAYSEIILNNGTPVGGSFVDDEGNCWTVEALTTDPVDSIRTLSNSYQTCSACIASNPCPQNFTIQSCCGDIPQIFSASLLGVNVGDTFVDTNGFCWSVVDVTGGPITNVVDVDTVYPSTTCESAECATANDCPAIISIRSCCGTLAGITTLELLQAALPSLVMGSIFVDTFGMCWEIRDTAFGFPDLSFIVPVTEYLGDGGMITPCMECTTANECPIEFYYTLQNCCTEEVEVVLLQPLYNIGETLLIAFTTGFGCYEVLSWSDTGTVTATPVDLQGVYENCEACTGASNQLYPSYCPGQIQCCDDYKNLSEPAESGFITGYKCDGTWVQDFVLTPGARICMAQVLVKSEFVNKVDCCGFDILNPSLTEGMLVYYETCAGDSGQAEIGPNTLLSATIGSCVFCIRRISEGDNDFVYVPCT